MAIAAPTVARVTLRGLLIPALAIAGYLFALGLSYALDAFVRALFGTLKGVTGWIPFAGKVIDVPLHAVERKVSHYVGAVEAALERRVSAAFSDMATVIVGLSVDVYETAIAIGQLSWFLAHKVPAGLIGRKTDRAYAKAIEAVRTARRAEALARRTTVALDHPTVGKVGAGTRVATKPLAQRITRLERTTDARLTRLETAIAVPLPHALPRVGARDRVARREIDRLRKWVKAHQRVIVGAAGVGLVLRALTKLKLGWLRCSNTGKVGRRVCRMDAGYLDALLAGSLLIVGSISIEEIARDIQRVTALGTEAVHGFIRETH